MRSQEVLLMIKVVRFMSFSEFLGLIEGSGFWSIEWKNPEEITDKVNWMRKRGI